MALSIVSKAGMPAAANRPRIVSVSRVVNQQASRLGAPKRGRAVQAAISPSAASDEDATPVGQFSASTVSMPGSRNSAVNAAW